MDWYKITKEDVVSMKKATRIVLLCDEKDGSVTVKLEKEMREKGFELTVLRKEFKTAASFLVDNNLKASRYHNIAFYLTGGSYGSGTWQAVCQIVKPDDIIGFRVLLYANSKKVFERGVESHLLQMSIFRGSKPVVQYFNIDSLLMLTENSVIHLGEYKPETENA